MDYCRPYLKPWLCALLLAAWPVVAQESIVFSKPGDLQTDKANDFMGDHRAGALINSPAPLANGKPRTDYDILPGAQKPHTPSPAEIKQWQKAMDERKNWTLMTPEQILGIQTPEQIYGLPDPNHEENLTVEEKYIRRQERARNNSATNALRRPDGFLKSDDNPFQSRLANQQQQDRRNGMQSASRLGLGAPTMPITDAGRNPDSIWHSAFNVIPETPKADPQQVAAMERFRAMMEPPAMEKPVAVSSVATPAPVFNHNMQSMPDYNPAGRTYAPLQNNAGRPTGINPLPTITGQRPLTLPKPKPLVKPPPWLSDEPQLGKPLERKF